MDSHCTPNKRSWFSWLCSFLQSPLLLAIRVVWGLLFIQTGVGKLTNMESTIEYFSTLDLASPVVAAWVVALVETIGGGFILVGLWARLAAIPLIVITVGAYAVAHQQVVDHFFTDFQAVINQTPFTFLFASLIIFAFGPGCFSLDWLWGASKKKQQSVK